ncbi:serine hydrolase domain-containing protein [Nonomuraea antimicrobica]|uniref:Serine hydrolase domain-containing protein n=1 Tax=Nonomuraea antimicrobica TaxID=561173 RepID=A0ABP7C3J4_9ACTN
MNKTLRTALCLLLAGTLVPAAATSAAATERPELQQVLDRAVAGGGVPGILAEVRDGRTRWFGTAGVADTGTGRERTSRDRFRIGSLSKAFTSTVVLQLDAEGRLDLDDTVESRLPGMVRGGDRITVRQLLNQTSGIFNYSLDEKLVSTYVGPGFLEHRFDRVRREDLVEIAMAHPPVFEPGEGWGYSNTNFVLAGMIIEKVTGHTYAQEVARRIARPLGLTGTYVPGDDETRLRGPHSRHYSKLMLPDPDAEVHDVTEMNVSGAWAAGGVVSTAGDLHRFMGALLGGRLLPPAQQRELLTGVSTEGGGWLPDTTYGLGIFWQKLACGVTVWGGGGAINGSWTYAMGSRDGRHLLVSNVNGDWDNPLATFNAALAAEFCPAR